MEQKFQIMFNFINNWLDPSFSLELHITFSSTYYKTDASTQNHTKISNRYGVIAAIGFWNGFLLRFNFSVQDSRPKETALQHRLKGAKNKYLSTELNIIIRYTKYRNEDQKKPQLVAKKFNPFATKLC